MRKYLFFFGNLPIFNKAIIFFSSVSIIFTIHTILLTPFFTSYWVAFGLFGFLIISSLWYLIKLGTNNRKLVFLIILCGAILLRLYWILHTPTEPVSDFAIYNELANSLAAGKGYRIDGPAGNLDLQLYIGGSKSMPYITAYRAPGIPLIGAFLYSIIGSKIIAFKIFNLFLGISCGFLIFILLRNNSRFPIPEIGFLLWAIYPTAWMATNLVATEIPFITALLGLTTILNKSDKQISDLKKYIFSGIMVGVLSFIRPSLTIIFLSICIALYSSNETRKLKKLLIISIALFFTILPWTIRNWVQFKHFIPICTNEGIALGFVSKNFVPNNFKTAEWNQKMMEWHKIDDEVVKAEMGYQIAKENYFILLRSGLKNTTLYLLHNFQKLMGNDQEICEWSIVNPPWLKNPGLSPFTCSLNNAFFYFGLVGFSYLFLLFTAIIGAHTFYIKKEILGFYFLQIFIFISIISHLLIHPGVRYHFYLMTFLIFFSSHGVISIRNWELFFPKNINPVVGNKGKRN